MAYILTAQIFSCWFLTGLIWLVQVLVYPNFCLVGKIEFKNFHEFHLNRITWVVAPVMGLELLSGILLFVKDHSAFYLCNAFSIVVLWILTGLVNVPSHNYLLHEEEITKRRLIVSNWPRTVLWTV